MSLIYEIKNATYSYKTNDALVGVTLSISEQESIVVLGANGSGKSTFVLLLGGILSPTAGSIKFMGRELNDVSQNKDRKFMIEFRRRVGVLLQNPDAMLFCETVREELAFTPLQFGWENDMIEKKITEVSKIFGIDHLLEKPSLRLSFGEKKRVALASVLACEPDILILDEPLSGLDPRSQALTVEVLIGLKERGKTLIVTTHDLESAEDYADRAIVFGEDHRVLKDGSAHEILEDIPLLLQANLIHEHAHRHGRYAHIHPHAFRHEHEE